MKLKIFQRFNNGYKEYKGRIDFGDRNIDIEDFKRFMKEKLPNVEHKECEEAE